MRIYQDCHEMHSEVKRDIHEMGIIVHPQTMQDKHVADDPAFRTLELSPCDFTILSGADRDQWLTDIGYNLEWAKEDFRERTCGLPVNPGRAWKLREETWREFLEPETKQFAYTYAERFAISMGVEKIEKHGVQAHIHSTVLSKTLHELTKNPDTRQAVIPIFNVERDLPNQGGKHRIPCSLHYQMMRRPDGLRLIYVMRSTDFVTHFPYDIWMALEMQAFFAKLLDIEPGRFTFFTGSLHIYAKDADQGVF